MGVEKDKRWVWAGPINSRNAYKTRENKQHHIRPHHRDWPQIEQKLRGRTHQQPKCLQNNGKTNKTIIGLITGIGLKLNKKLLLHKEKRQKDKWFRFHAATVLGFPKAKNVGDVRLPKHIKTGHLIYLRYKKGWDL